MSHSSRAECDHATICAIFKWCVKSVSKATGTVEFIEPGIIRNETAEGVISLYRARISLNEDLLTSKSGEEIELVRSMPVEARVVYQEEPYLERLLDLLN